MTAPPPDGNLDARAGRWAALCEPFLREHVAGDAAHDLAHVRRVVAWAGRIGRDEGADLDVVLPAAWLHDCVVLPKDHPARAQASRRAAERAAAWLREHGEPEARVAAVAHAIEAHSFSAGVEPRTLEARVVQDADRLDALGAIGVARCYATAGALGAALTHPTDPVPTWADPDAAPPDAAPPEPPRPLDDRRYATDHVYAKLLRLPSTMRTRAGRAEAERRAAFLRAFLAQLASEAGGAS
ncbi:HD domain-containing protein [Rubrivirga sp. S365]|uniref:HD domain-containing protein n=1 Tax=Rubrivirga litoralis TaxID=3075598 RepID=A0ABU3BNB1_9BACT|nr:MULTISPECIES: HD domain-containing protein [unclassified Rubrivirga]MDT0630710.1 HD domain-containing protein [Rubrivirga sp. F394]MDT7856282.1 HD domain-containing protein [Rubrivirga sp. S365]